ncbi:LOW QUALITY PROTEIN: inositol polyphosphate multikinase-like [Eurosta solidaginis]|uniref:LOW QUALITY PROTEIN: inositol polyphosphate multikinase-like n=1 Tax=Eurosta solidaginis TaxID=178769 RepID=UPI0035316CBA
MSRKDTNTSQEAHYQIQLPAGFAAMQTQVAGHIFDSATMGLLQDNSGCVLKPLGKPECGERELNFYESLQLNDSNPLLMQLRAFVPKFHKKVKLVVNNRHHMFIKLEDLTYGMQKPCIIDIKIGKRTWDPPATEQKRHVEEQKYVKCKQLLGLCVPGFQVYTPTEPSKALRYSKEYGKNLDANGFRTTIALFVNAQNGKVYKPLVYEILSQLYKIREWFKMQKLYNFYASSILIVYDFDKLESYLQQNCEGQYAYDYNRVSNMIVNGDALNSHNAHTIVTTNTTELYSTDFKLAHWIKVKMIDFAHVFPAADQSSDDNYIFGLENLVIVFEELLA